MNLYPRARRRWGFAAAALLAATSIAACGSGNGQSASPASGAETTLTMWVRNHSDNSVKRSVAAFEESHPGLKVEVSIVEDDQYLTKLATAIRAGSAPDLIRLDIVNAPLLATQGVLLDLTNKVSTLGNKDQLAPAGVEIGLLDGANYSLPAALTVSQMFWNKALFEKAGLDPTIAPTTLEEVTKAAEAIDALGEDVTGFSTLGGTGQAFTGFPSGWADGGTLFTALSPEQKATFNDPAMVDMVTWYKKMWESGLMQKTDEPNQDPGNVGQQNALEGKVGLIFTGANLFTEQQEQFGSAAGIPGNDGKLATFLGGDSYGIPATAAHPEEAWTLLEWMVSSEECATILNEEGWIPPDQALGQALAETEWDKTRVAALAVGELPATIAYFATVNDPNGPWAQNSRKAIFEGGDPQSVMDKATEEANALIAEAYTQVG